MKDLQQVRFNNNLILTTEQLAEFYGTSVDNIKKNFSNNKNKFIEGKHYYELKGNDLKEFKRQVTDVHLPLNKFASHLILWTKKGASRHSKMLGTDRAWDIFDELEENYFNPKQKVLSSTRQTRHIDVDIKRMNAEARLKNANVRQAKLYVELSKGATTEVNKALLQDKAVETLDGKKLLEMPKLREHFYDTDEIAKQVGILSKSGKPHGTAVSQIIKKYIEVEDNESEILPETNGGWSGSVTKYTKPVITKLHEWLKEKQYPALIKGDSKNYHVTYDFDI